MKPDQAARDANIAANDATKAAVLTHEAAARAEAARREINERFPTDHEQMVRALASQEQSAMLRIGPRRNRWKELHDFEQGLVEIEQRRTVLLEDLTALNLELANEPQRHTAALAEWMAAGEQGERPLSRVPALEAEKTERQAECDALGIRYDQMLRERAEHVQKNRRRLVADVDKQKQAAAAEYARLVDELQAKRQELLELRATELWCALFPSELLQLQPNTQNLAGASKRVQGPLLLGVEAPLPAANLFELLRADVRFCESVATVEQAAAIQGVSVAALTNREAQWRQGGPDAFGPSFAATWARSAEEKAEAERQRKYIEAQRKRLWGE
jgi:hypothetical protein